MTTLNLSIPPYFDDYNEQKGFAKILFKPGVGVQVRELNQLQTILQKQVSRIGDHLFKQGSMIIPGGTTYDLNVKSLKISSTYSSLPVNYTALIGTTLSCVSSGCKFKVITAVTDPSNSAVKVLIVSLVASGGTNRDVNVPTAGETLNNDATLANVATIDTVAGYYNNSSIAHIDDGIFYSHGYFIKVVAQTLVLSLYTNNPTLKVGLNVVESIVTEANDITLLDPAFGSSNENAPGAHRLKIELIFTQVDSNTPQSDSFIELMNFVSGQLVFQQNKTEYAEVMKTLARRTFEAEGNYTVKNFVPSLREHLLSADGKNGGLYTAGQGGDASKFVLQLTPGVAFVNGYETQTIANTLVAIPKSRDTMQVLNDIIRPQVGNYFMIGNVVGMPDINTRPYVELRNNSSLGTSPTVYSVIGYAVIDNLDYYSGTIGTTTEILKARVSQLKLTAGGIVNTVPITNGGNGYGVSIPTVTISGDGVGATAVAVLTAGVVTSITVTGVGSGYTNATAVISAPVSGVTATASVALYFYNIEDVGSIAQINTAGTTPFKADVLTEYTISGNNGVPAIGSTFNDANVTAKAKVYSWDAVRKLLYGLKTGSTIADEILTAGMYITNGTVTGTVVDKIVLKSPSNNDMIFDIPYTPVKTLSNLNNVTNIQYTVNREYSILLDSGGAGSIVAGANETIAPFTSSNFISIITASGTPAHIGLVDITNYINSTNPTSYSITFGAAYAGDTIKVIVPIVKLLPTFRTKTLVANSELMITAARMARFISLMKSDIYRIVGVWQNNNVAAINTYADIIANPLYYRDIKYQFTLDNGQRDAYITNGSIVLNSTLALPTNNIVIVFDYFTSGTGEFFCVDSYASLTSYLDLNPSYTSKSSNTTHQLYSSIDFRPVSLANVNEFSVNIVSGSPTVVLDGSERQSTTALTAGQTIIGQGIPVGATILAIVDINTFTLSANATATTNKLIVVVGGQSGTTYLTKFKESIDYGQMNIKSNTDFKTDLQYFIPRIDSIYLTSESQFEWVKGTPNPFPVAEDKSSEAKMRMMDLYIPAYTFDVKMITIQKLDNPGYTMKNIAKLEQRIVGLEQFTKLTSLEKQTKDLTIIDPATGLNRMKLGFGMDGFKDNSLADLNDQEYHAAMNTAATTCGCPLILRDISVAYSTASTNVALVDSVQLSGIYNSNTTMAMLPYTEVTLLAQTNASEFRNINPFASYGWYGKMRLLSNVDVWTDVSIAPNVIVSKNTTF